MALENIKWMKEIWHGAFLGGVSWLIAFLISWFGIKPFTVSTTFSAIDIPVRSQISSGTAGDLATRIVGYLNGAIPVLGLKTFLTFIVGGIILVLLGRVIWEFARAPGKTPTGMRFAVLMYGALAGFVITWLLGLTSPTSLIGFGGLVIAWAIYFVLLMLAVAGVRKLAIKGDFDTLKDLATPPQ